MDICEPEAGPAPPDPASITPALIRQVKNWFPKLAVTRETFTSERNPAYDCFAFAAGDYNNRWNAEPVDIDGVYWPAGARSGKTLDVFMSAYAVLGFARCDDDGVEDGFEKIALYVLGSTVMHAARQMRDGMWRSKLGPFEDIQHAHPHDVEGRYYGTVAAYMKRRLTSRG